jgi:hypothetical protein
LVIAAADHGRGDHQRVLSAYGQGRARGRGDWRRGLSGEPMSEGDAIRPSPRYGETRRSAGLSARRPFSTP